ncbi:MAG: nucleotide exchange factor GrpE [Candidatus Wallacebacter cryptica]|nr:nucleotide exchange factor GrpE [Bacillota bacterium]
MKENKEHELCSEETVEEIEQEDLEQAVDQDEQKSEDQIELLTKQWEQERDGLVNQLLRLKADFDNYKRRSEASIEAIRATANQNLMAELLPVIDNFERALNAADDSPYVSGVKMIFNQLLDCLCRQGLQPINAVGQPFDPNIHEAVSMQGQGSDLIVTAELQKGYLFKDKLLRASMVQVAPNKQNEEE